MGGAGSGKSRFAVETAERGSRAVSFVATCDPTDGEMGDKIRRHKKERPSHWSVIEAASTPFEAKWPNGKADCILVDSLTLWVSTLAMKDAGRDEIISKCAAFLTQARKKFKRTIVVSDEVGLGVVPENGLARSFRETLGKVNQQAAKLADEAYLVAAGLPIALKGKRRKT